MQGGEGDDENDVLFKFILVGDAGISTCSPGLLTTLGVGKSSILLKYTTNEFKRDYNVTIGVEFGSKYIQLDPDTRIKLQVWDTVLTLCFLK